MHDVEIRKIALLLRQSGLTRRATAQALGVGYNSVARWERRLVPIVAASVLYPSCWRCDDRGTVPDVAAYLYVLGLYLGDGHVRATKGNGRTLSIACCDVYPRLIDECEAALRLCVDGAVWRAQKTGYTAVESLSRHWSCLLPQHGPGKKHEREIRLEPWQQALVDSDPRPLVRGLLHSDGCRADNRIVRRLPSGTRHYSYPRYFFSNTSDDIRRILTDALDALGIAWRTNNPNSVSIARREAVAALDAFVGPKH